MKKLINLILLLSVFTLPSIVMAKEKNGVSEYAKKREEGRKQDINKFDINRDGVLQLSELKQSNIKKFNIIDTNKDGFLSKREINSSLQKFKKSKKSLYDRGVISRANRLKNRYKNADINHDEKVSNEEFQRYMSNRQKNFDNNRDGIISKDEYRVDDEKNHRH
jgi:EF-hand domain pair/EF hand